MNNKLEKVVDLFMEENDKQALEELYKITNDKLIKILIDWNKEYEVELQDVYTYPSSMYEDIMNYVWDKYKLNEISKEKNIDEYIEY